MSELPHQAESDDHHPPVGPKSERGFAANPDLVPPQPSPRRALAVLALMLAIAAGGWFLFEKLSADSTIQDCVMAGRSNCAPLAP